MRQRGRGTILRDLKVNENLGPERKESPPPWSTQRDKQGRLIPRAADFNLLQSGTRRSPTHNNLSTILLANEGFSVTAEKSCTYISVLNYLHPSFVFASKPPASKMSVNKCQKKPLECALGARSVQYLQPDQKGYLRLQRLYAKIATQSFSL